MSYASVHKSNERFELVVTLILLGTAILTMTLMFIHPTAAILLFWVGFASAMVAGGVEMVMRRLERAEIRRAVAAGVCPQCGAALDSAHAGQDSWRCDHCHANFESAEPSSA